MIFATILQFVLLSAAFYLVCGQDQVRVKLKNNYEIIGRNISNRHAHLFDVGEFLGIPYAKPPNGSLRFAPPQPLDDKEETGVRYATTLSKTCWQPGPTAFENSNAGARIWYNNTEMDEDCLYLNVWRPFTPNRKERLPVMVWIFGGGFYSGSANLQVYNGTMLAGINKVVVVSMQYRVGALGFLCFKKAMKIKPKRNSTERLAACNMGLEDQQMALKWVKKNIGAFGGDPSLITLFGESAGSASVSLHYLSPGSRPLFHQMIMQSASVFNRWALISPNEAHNRSRAFAKACNCTQKNLTNLVECLQNRTAVDLVNKATEVYNARAARRNEKLKKLSPPMDIYDNNAIYASFEFAPTVDGVFLPKCPDDIFHELISKPERFPPRLLIGTMANEGMYWLLYGLAINNVSFLSEDGNVSLPDPETLRKAKFDYYNLTIAKIISEQNLNDTIVNFAKGELLGFYELYRHKNISNSTEFMHVMDGISGDIEFTCGTQKFAQYFTHLPNANVYNYVFVHKTEDNRFPNWTGAMHGYEIDYAFGMPFSKEFRHEFYNYTDSEERLSATVMKYWANFARCGNPTQNEDGRPMPTIWPKYDLRDGKYMEIGLKQTVKQRYRKVQCDFWNDRLPLFVQARMMLEKKKIDVCPSIEPYYNTPRNLTDYVNKSNVA